MATLDSGRIQRRRVILERHKGRGEEDPLSFIADVRQTDRRQKNRFLLDRFAIFIALQTDRVASFCRFIGDFLVQLNNTLRLFCSKMLRGLI